MQELMPGFHCNRVSFSDRQFGAHGNVDFGMKAVPKPTSAHFCNSLHALYMPCGVFYLINDFGFNTVKQTTEYGLAGIPNNFQNSQTNERANNRVSQGKAEPNTDCAQQDS